MREEYSSTIINSRLIIFGMNTDGSPIDASQKQPSSSPVPSQHSQLHSDGNPDSDHGISAVAGCGDSAKESASSGPDGDMNGAKGGNNSETTVMENMEKNIVGEETDLNPREGRTGSENCSVTITRVGGDASCAPQHSDVAAGKKELASGGKENDGAEKGRLHSNSLTKESTGSEVVFYPSLEQCSDLEERLKVSVLVPLQCEVFEDRCFLCEGWGGGPYVTVCVHACKSCPLFMWFIVKNTGIHHV